MSNDGKLHVNIFPHAGGVVLSVSTDDGDFVIPMTPDVADEFGDHMHEAAAMAREENPEAVQ